MVIKKKVLQNAAFYSAVKGTCSCLKIIIKAIDCTATLRQIPVWHLYVE